MYPLLESERIVTDFPHLEEIVTNMEKYYYHNMSHDDELTKYFKLLEDSVDSLSDEHEAGDALSITNFLNARSKTKKLKYKMKTTVFLTYEMIGEIESRTWDDELKKLLRYFVDTDIIEIVIKESEIIIYHKHA